MAIENPFVNIVVLNWNNFEDTKECIESVLKIDYDNYGITLVDNFSEDSSLKRLEFSFSTNSKIKFLKNSKNEGFAKGNNLAMRKDVFKNSDYFLLLNNDTIVDSKFLKKLVKFSKYNKNIGVVSPSVYNYYFKDKKSKIDYPGKFNLFFGGGKVDKISAISKKSIKVDYCSGCCWLIKKEIFKEIGGFNEKYFVYCEEMAFAYKVKEKGYLFYLLPSSKIWHKGSKTANKIIGLKLYYLTRNTIWLERQNASFCKYIIFLLYIFSYKTIRVLIKVIQNKNKLSNLESYIKGLIHGLFKNL